VRNMSGFLGSKVMRDVYISFMNEMNPDALIIAVPFSSSTVMHAFAST